MADYIDVENFLQHSEKKQTRNKTIEESFAFSSLVPLELRMKPACVA
jgi:hypothetical protein